MPLIDPRDRARSIYGAAPLSRAKQTPLGEVRALVSPLTRQQNKDAVMRIYGRQAPVVPAQAQAAPGVPPPATTGTAPPPAEPPGKPTGSPPPGYEYAWNEAQQAWHLNQIDTSAPSPATTGTAPPPQRPPTGDPAPDPESLPTPVRPPGTGRPLIPRAEPFEPISFQERLDAILRGDSALLRQAATRGKQYAQSRGLLNTSLAAQASQQAVLGEATKIAQADVQTDLESRKLNLQERAVALDEGFRRDELKFRQDTESQRLGFDRERFESDADYRDRQLAQMADLENRKLGLQAKALDLDEGFRQTELEWKQDAENQRLSFDQARFDSDADYRDRQLKQMADLENRRIDNELKRIGIDTTRLDQDTKRSAYQLLDGAARNHAMMVSNIYNNPNMDAAGRQKALANAARVHLSAQHLINDMFDLKLDLSPLFPSGPPPVPPQTVPDEPQVGDHVGDWLYTGTGWRNMQTGEISDQPY